MKTKKIIADTMPQALKMVRQQLGDNAIIVNTRAINTGGLFGFFSKQKYEVTAYTVDKEEAPLEPMMKYESKEKPIRPVVEIKNQDNHIPNDMEKQNSVFHKTPQKLYQFYSQPETVKDKKASAPSQPELENEKQAKPLIKSADTENHLLDEIKHMRKMMMTLMMGDKQGSNIPVSVVTHVNQLRKQGVDEEIIEFIVNQLLKKFESIHDTSEEIIKNEIISIIEAIITNRISESMSISESIRMINIIGPTGVGKTTSIAKLATEQVLKQKRRVAMITTDVYRIAAVEQLKTYAGILNVPIEVVRSADELEQAISKLEHYDLIYMDTTGRNYKEAKYRESINEFINHPLKSDNYLVLSLTTKFEDMEILLKEFLESPIKKLILTKLDETTSYGSILNIAYKYPYQLAYITNGQSVPEDIAAIDPSLLARYLLGEE
ncbi:flagellar biosynthesis protein FlhF [Neobacillus niacini]|uniref:flagellar biosynthesis protein FlhF n=1 Tax=Neobacillus niacini TaxID=86668 RepID=UPI003002BBD9